MAEKVGFMSKKMTLLSDKVLVFKYHWRQEKNYAKSPLVCPMKVFGKRVGLIRFSNREANQGLTCGEGNPRHFYMKHGGEFNKGETP